MNKFSKIISVSLISLVFGSAAFAQFPGLNRASSGTSTTTNLLESFAVSNKHTVDAQIHFATAFGLQDQINLLQAEQSALSGGQIDQESTEKAILVSENAQKAISERMESQPELTAEGRESYQQGLISYFLAMATARDVIQAGSQVQRPSLRNPLAAVNDAQSSLYVVREAPGYLRRLQENASMLITYGRNNNIEPPENATALLEGL